MHTHTHTHIHTHARTHAHARTHTAQTHTHTRTRTHTHTHSVFTAANAGALITSFITVAETTFNEALQVCDYPGHAPPPCGTHTGGYTATPAGPWPEYPLAG